MNGERLRTKFEQILQTDIVMERMTLAKWHALGGSEETGEGAGAALSSRISDGKLYFPIDIEGQSVSLFAVEAQSVTPTERMLVELAIGSQRLHDKKRVQRTDNEAFMIAVRDWIEERITAGMPDDQDFPAELARYSSLYATKIPFMIYGEYTNTKAGDYSELKKLLESFFGGDIHLIPLKDKEWLVLGGESLLSDPDDEDESMESDEDRLSSLCSGLYSVITTEGAGECHVSVYYPIVPVKSLPATVIKLREAISAGRLLRVSQNIHLPWELYLDQLLSPLTHNDRMKFIEHVFKRKDPHLDTEMLQTLEMFFELDCNVSETAKKLFIHRNTLLYRLDKFKQESGLDVRVFNQAVHVKIALQLYKVTKRL